MMMETASLVFMTFKLFSNAYKFIMKSSNFVS